MEEQTTSRRAGSHRAVREPGRARWGLIAMALVLVAAVAGYLTFRGEESAVAGDDGVPGCSGNLTIAVAPELEAPVGAALEESGCGNVRLFPAAPQQVINRILTGKQLPELWIPDSSVWTTQAGKAATIAEKSIATSPAVIVAGSGEPPSSWADAVGADDFLLGNPLSSAASAAALYAGTGGAEDAVAGLAQRSASDLAAAPDPAAQLTRIQKRGGTTVVTEQQWLSAAPGLRAVAPVRGTAMMEYPLVITAPEEDRGQATEAAAAIGEILTGESGQATLAEAGFRGPDAAPAEQGVGKVQPIQVGAKDAAELLGRWATMAVPMRSLAVVDVSGSMDFAAGTTTRMGLTTQAAAAGLSLFQDNAAIGLWAFSQADDGLLGADYRQLQPIRRLDEDAGGATQRDLLAGEFTRMGDIVGGGTSLYDTTLAAYEAAVESYDPAAVNSVLLLTDGANDDPDSLTQAELIAALRKAADPERPVRIITLGITDDADAAALKAIAAATGGQSYLARSPADIGRVFADAIAARH
ncbi:VWA domain-containing protein [Nocardioides sp. BGMRC 2183]|nr:VWA domain-containing protein [Nocardioides sp. BGMRC 2183]